MEKMFNQLLQQMKELTEQLHQQTEQLTELQEIIAAKDAQIAALTTRIEELTHKKNSGNSSKPPSSERLNKPAQSARPSPQLPLAALRVAHSVAGAVCSDIGVARSVLSSALSAD